jgi:hypothetical protein
MANIKNHNNNRKNAEGLDGKRLQLLLRPARSIDSRKGPEEKLPQEWDGVDQPKSFLVSLLPGRGASRSSRMSPQMLRCRLAAEENTRTSDVKRGVFPLCRVADSRMADGQASRSSSRQDRQYMAQQQGNTSMTSNHKTSTNTIRALALHSTTRQHLIPTRPVTC